MPATIDLATIVQTTGRGPEEVALVLAILIGQAENKPFGSGTRTETLALYADCLGSIYANWPKAIEATEAADMKKAG